MGKVGASLEASFGTEVEVDTLSEPGTFITLSQEALVMELPISGLRYELLHITMNLRVPLVAWLLAYLGPKGADVPQVAFQPFLFGLWGI